MHFVPPLEPAQLIRRYKRFLADVERNGEVLTVHCPNTGAMLGCAEPDSPVWLHRAANPKRKYAFTWELVQVTSGVVVGVNTGRANNLVREAIEGGRIPALTGYDDIRAEVRYGAENSRIDFVLSGAARTPCYVEVKNVTAAVTDGVALFPDAVTVRGQRHLREMQVLVESGTARAALVFCVQRRDVHEVRPADSIDAAYGTALRQAMDAGVEVYAIRGAPSAREITLDELIPVIV